MANATLEQSSGMTSGVMSDDDIKTKESIKDQGQGQSWDRVQQTDQGTSEGPMGQGDTSSSEYAIPGFEHKTDELGSTQYGGVKETTGQESGDADLERDLDSGV